MMIRAASSNTASSTRRWEQGAGRERAMLSMLSNGRIYRHACFDSNGLHADQLKRVGCAAGVGAGIRLGKSVQISSHFANRFGNLLPDPSLIIFCSMYVYCF
jgi:hypothetical protein